MLYLTPKNTLTQIKNTVQRIQPHTLASFVFGAAKIWSDFPNSAPSATSISSFRKNLKSYLFAKVCLP